MRRCWLLGAIACSAPPGRPLANTAPPRTLSPVTPLACDKKLRDGERALHGHVRDRATDEPLAGVTLAASVRGSEVRTAITDENGCYFMAIPDVAYVAVAVYYLELSVERPVRTRPGIGAVDFELDAAANAAPVRLPEIDAR